ncbi:MAG: hypothetical protein ACYC7L_18875 [Nitrospirota bacterium]
MKECEHCGAEFIEGGGAVAEPGTVGGGQAISDVAHANVKGARKELFEEIKDEHEREALIQGASTDNICPKCGMVGGGQTITDMPKLHLREAHKKLKEEIKEAKERDREERKK